MDCQYCELDAHELAERLLEENIDIILEMCADCKQRVKDLTNDDLNI